MNRDNQDFQDYQYGNNTQYYHYNNPQEMYYQGGYAVQGEYYGHSPHAYHGPQYYGQYGDLNYYNGYPQQEGYFNANSYGYGGDFYQGNSQAAGSTTAPINDNNNARQQTRGKHSYSQNRSRNRQRADSQLQRGSKTSGEHNKDSNAQDGKKVSNDVENPTANLMDASSTRGKKQGGRFYGSDTRSKPFENKSRRQNVEVGSRDRDSKDVQDDTGEASNKTENTNEHGAKPKATKQHTNSNWDEKSKYDRSRFERYGKENIYVKQRPTVRRYDVDNQQNPTSNENTNNNSRTRDYEGRSDIQVGNEKKLQLNQRKTYERSSDFSKKDKMEDSFDYRAESAGMQRTQQQRHQRGTTRNRGLKKVDESQRGINIFKGN